MSITAELRQQAERYIRPSALAAVADCPGRPLMEAAIVAAIGEGEPDEAASVGTVCHDTVAHAITEWKEGKSWGDAAAYALNISQAAGMDQWSLRCCQMAIEFARDLITKHGVEPENVLAEHQLDMSAFTFNQPGTADLVLIIPFERVIVVDWKMGFLDQGEAIDHDQLQAYAIAAAGVFRVDEVLVYLYQPRAEASNRASAAKFDAESLNESRAWTMMVLRAARAENPTLNPTYKACLNCKALARCAAAKEWIVKVQDALMRGAMPATSDAWGEWADAAKVSQKAGKTGEEHVKKHLADGGEATGWALQSSGTTTKIDPAKALAIAKEGCFLPDLLQFASFKSEAAKVLPIDDAVTVEPKALSLKPVKG